MDKQNRKSLFSILFVAAMDNFGFGVVFVMFAPLVFSPQYQLVHEATSMGMRHVYLALLFATFPLAQLFGAPILGDIADQIGRKKALYLSILGVIIGFLISGLSIIASSLSLLIFSRFFTGFFAGNLSICLSAIADLSPTEKIRSRNFGIVTVIWAVTWNIAMLVGGYLSDPTKSSFFSPALPFWITAGFTALSFFPLSKYYTESFVQEDRSKLNFSKGMRNIIDALKIPQLRLFFATLTFWTLGWGLAVQWYGTYGILKYEASQETISWGLFIQGITWALGGSLFNPLLLRRYKTLPIALIGLVGATLLLAVAGIASSYFTFCAFWWAAAAFASFALSNTMNLTSMHAPAEVQGKVMGLTQSMLSVGWTFTPLIGGFTGAKNIDLFYPASATLMGVALILMLIQSKRASIENTERALDE